MSARIKGQEVEVLLIKDGQIVDTITSVKSFEMKYQFDIMSEGFLGEKTERKDNIFKGISASMEMQFDTKNIFDLFVAIKDKAQRRTPGVRINVKATLNFPDGARGRVIIPDVTFGEIPVSFGSRADFGTVSLSMEASDCQSL